jgi:uncharacterized protein involved in exopolysaccharide biosynthesis
MMQEQTKEIGDYISALHRRKKQVAIIAVVMAIITCLVAYMLPPVYRSQATILIKEQDIPKDLVRSTITSYAAQQIRVISQQVMTRGTLMEIIDKFGLYEDERKRKTTEEILDKMRSDIKLETIDADVVDPRSGKPMVAMIAFTLAFESKRADLAQKVANELTTQFLGENIRARAEQASEAKIFLAAEADRLAKQISELEKRLAEVKEENLGVSPELADLNMRQMERAQQSIDDTNNQINSLDDRLFFLRNTLSQTDPYNNTLSPDSSNSQDPGTRLRNLRSDYTSAISRYSLTHPDIIRMRSQITALEQETGQGVSFIAQQDKLLELRNRLSALQGKYADEHPDVVSARKAIAALEAEIAAYSIDPSDPAATGRPPTNPVYVNTREQIVMAESALKTLHAKLGQYQEQMKTYEARLLATPSVERLTRDISREYANAVAKFRDIKAKELEADVAQQLEKERKGERFSLIDPAVTPEKPIKPNRPAILFLGLVLSLASGIGYSTVMETLDKSVRGISGVTGLLQTAPLSLIPVLENDEDLARHSKSRWRWVAVVLVVIAVVLLLAHLWTPLDVLWFRGLRKLESI